MSLPRRTILLLGACTLFSIATAGQTQSSGGQSGTITMTVGSATTGLGGPGFVCSIRLTMPRAVPAGPTTPYSAVRESSSIQTLSDGTHFSQNSPSAKIYQDSQGRTRTEHAVCPEASQDPDALYIQVQDPVAGFAFILDPQNHTAHRYVLHVREQTPPPAAPADKAPKAATGVIVKPSERRADLPEITDESLGTQTIEGISVQGTRHTMVFPAGSQGNDRPIAVVREIWISTELKVTVLEKSSDPRYGEQTIRLTNVDTGEPSPLLFQVPADYKVVDETEPIRITYHTQP